MLKRDSRTRLGIYFFSAADLGCRAGAYLGPMYLCACRWGFREVSLSSVNDLWGGSNGLLLNANYRRVVQGDCVRTVGLW